MRTRAGASTLFALALAAIAPPPASGSALGVAELLPSAAVRTAGTLGTTCQRQAAPGREGVVRRVVRTDANGLVRATLTGGRGDWDLAVLGTGGDVVAASASFGPDELAEGIVAGGRTLVVQACRRERSASRHVTLRVANVPLPAPSGDRIRMAKVLLPTDAAHDLLDGLGLDLTEHGRPGFREVLLYSDADERTLRASGLQYVITIPDVVEADRRARARAARSESAPGPVPSGRLGYRRLGDYGDDLKALAAENPNLVKPITLPHRSLEGRPIEGVEITRDVHARDGKPVFLQMGVHHAREWPSGELSIEFAFDLVNAVKAEDPRASALLDKARVIVVPIINPDGFNLSREAPIDTTTPLVDPGFAYKRKNCRVVDGAIPAEGECALQANRDLGTDPNRNYGQFWGGPGAAAFNVDDTYRGAEPFSEPETQNVRELVSTRHVTTLITNHTYSDLVLRPPGLDTEGDPPDEPIYKALGDAMAAENGYLSQKSFELYNTTGTTEDWSYYATGGLGFTFEIGKASEQSTAVGVGFHPPYPIGVLAEYNGKYPTGGGNREAYYLALEHTADASKHAVLTGTAPAGADIRLTKEFLTYPSNEEAPAFQDVLDTRTTVPASGTFEYHVNPSTRPITVKAGGPAEAWTLECVLGDGTVAGRQEVVVGRGERKELGEVCNGSARRLGLKIKPGKGSLRKGLRVRVTCTIDCRLKATLRARGKVIARAKRRAEAGRTTLRLEPTRAARSLGRVKAKLTVTARAKGSRAKRTRRVTLR